VKAVLKRSGASAQTQKQSVRFGDVEIDMDSCRVFRGGNLVNLKPMELKLLLYLFDNQGRRVTKDELLEKVWEGAFVGEGTLSVHIRHLREKLEKDPQNPVFIKTMWGSGYMFESQQ
jgi:two-component system response regulator RegX3